MSTTYGKERTLTEQIGREVATALPGVEVLAVELSAPDRFTVFVDHAEGVDHALCARVTDVRAGVRLGRIVTTRPEDRTRRRGAAQREDAHYVYRRTGLPCRVCGTEVRTEVMAGRNLYWCPFCQPA